jgi:head-tail adaptor
MSVPQLNRKLVLEAPLRVPDGAGGFSESWGALGVLWASVRAGTGREAEAAGLSISTVPYKITVRAAPVGAASRPVAGQRMRDGGRIFRVLAVTETDERARYLTRIAREEVVT